jgi:hypothetical protein
MTQRILALASMSQLPLSDDRVLDILADMWMRVFGRADSPGRTSRPSLH